MQNELDLSTIYHRLENVGPRQLAAKPIAGQAGAFQLTTGDAPVVPADAVVAFLAHAVDDIASMAAEIEQLRSDNAQLSDENRRLWARNNELVDGVNGFVRRLGGDSGHGNLQRAEELIHKLITEIEQTKR